MPESMTWHGLLEPVMHFPRKNSRIYPQLGTL